MTTKILATDTASLEALFALEMAVDSTENTSPADWQKIKCRKCNGTGNFIGYTGRVVGKCFTCQGVGFKMTEAAADNPHAKAIDVSKIEVAFAAARSNGIKRPKLRLGTFMFSRAPDSGRNAGSIYVKEGEQYLGKVSDGQFLPVRECGDERKAKVVEVAANPSASAKAFGLRTGSCSCCGRTLTNGESIDLGIGPICASKYGW